MALDQETIARQDLQDLKTACSVGFKRGGRVVQQEQPKNDRKQSERGRMLSLDAASVTGQKLDHGTS